MRKKLLIVLLPLLLCGCGSTKEQSKTSHFITPTVTSEIGKDSVPDSVISPEPSVNPGEASQGDGPEETIPDNNEGQQEIVEEITPTSTPVITEAPPTSEPEEIAYNFDWEFAGNSKINSGKAVKYYATSNRKNITVAINAGHGTQGGNAVRTLCHPDGSAKTTGGSTSEGSTTAAAVSGGMCFNDGTAEATATLETAVILKEKLLARGYDVVMLRDGSDVQLDNVARTVIANNTADFHISLHWDGDGLGYDKGAFYISVPDSIKNMYPVSTVWQENNALGQSLINGLSEEGVKLFSNNMGIDLTQTSYSTIPTVDMELGNQCSSHDYDTLSKLAEGLAKGVDYFSASLH